MAEYLAPGVYVEEFDSHPQPISGTLTLINNETAQLLLESIKRTTKIAEADWASFNHSDPGITLIELCAWLIASLVYSENGASDARLEAARRAFAMLGAPQSAPSVSESLVRPRFFAGRLLDAATLTAEQDYQREKLRQHNRTLHGVGIVAGLGVQIDTSGAEPRVAVAPGCALDFLGEEVAISQRVTLRLPFDAREAFVSIRRWERPRDPLPSLSGCESTAIEEATIIAISERVPATAIALARLIQGSTGWSVDPDFGATLSASRPRP